MALEFGISRETVRKMLRDAVPPRYQRQQPVKRPKLGPWLGAIFAILEDDKRRPAKQRHTAKRIPERLRADYAFSGGYTIVQDYVHTQKLRSREMSVPPVHAPGEAQAEFGEALVVGAGAERKAHYLSMACPTSTAGFLWRFQPRPQRLFSKAASVPSPISAAYPRAFSTTTRRSPD